MEIKLAIWVMGFVFGYACGALVTALLYIKRHINEPTKTRRKRV
jgi:uncharacterized membrane protein YciS (DUF1049 family)